MRSGSLYMWKRHWYNWRLSHPCMKIAYFYQEPWEEEYVRSALSGDDVHFYRGSLAENASVSDAEASALSVFVNSHVGEEELSRFPKLQFIATRSTGFDHIDLEAVKKRGIKISTVPFYGENTVAEFTFALILELSRKVALGHRRVVETGAFSQEGLRGFDLSGKTIGIVGGGHIGVRVARIAKGFEMNVLVFDVHKDEKMAEDIGFSYASLDDLLAESDITTLHVPYNEHTHHLINQDNIRKIKRGAYLINTARGGVIETEALVGALNEGILAGAGLDVLEEEGDLSDELKLLGGPHPQLEDIATALQNHFLIRHPRVVVTPHVAFNTKEAIMRILDTTIENIRAFSKDTPQNLVA